MTYETYEDLIQGLVQEGYLKTPGIIEAFQAVKRIDFMRDETKSSAFVDAPIPIFYKQSISQPAVVAFMLELLEPKEGEKILDIGSGSGWTTTLLSKIVGQEGKIIAIEFLPQLKEFGERNAARYNLTEGIAEFICNDGSKGWEEKAPYDKILVSAEAKKLPPELKRQLKVGGRIVIPLGYSIWLFVKKSETEFEEKEYPGYNFVPLLDESERLDKEKTREFLKNPLSLEVLGAIACSEDQSPAIDQIKNLINLGFAQGKTKLLCSSEEVAEVVFRLSELRLIKPTWTLAVSVEEIKDLLEDSA